jgi:hypothetical protein
MMCIVRFPIDAGGCFSDSDIFVPQTDITVDHENNIVWLGNRMTIRVVRWNNNSK